MRLYLSSFDIGNQPDRLVSLVGRGRRAVVVLNALDHKEEARNKFLVGQTKALTDLGFITEELDLRNYFNRPSDLRKKLEQTDLIWINGGNTFNLRRAMKQSGFDILVKEFLANDSLVYGGFSAAVCVITPTLKGLEITDDPHKIPEGYEEAVIWEGLDLIDYSVAVHYKSDHPESHLTDKEIAFYEENHMPYKTLRDGEVIIVNGEKTEFLS